MIIQITCHGGVREIGGNKIVVEFSVGKVLLDFGVSYKRKALYYEEYLAPRTNAQLHDYLQLGILPRIPGLYRRDAFAPLGDPTLLHRSAPLWQSDLTCAEEYCEAHGKPPVDALLLTHAHDDHMGLIGFLGHVPIYCSEPTQKLLEASMDVGNHSGFERDAARLTRRILQATKSGFVPGAPKIISGQQEPRQIHSFDPHHRFPLQENPEITVWPIAVSHSVPGATAFVLECQGKTVVYSGDIRFHGRWNIDPLRHLADLRPDVLLIEGTRVTEGERDDETRVCEELTAAFRETRGLAMVGFAWKDVERYETVKEAAEAAGRDLVIFPRLAYLLHRLSYDLDSDPHVHVFLERSHYLLYSPADYVGYKYKAGYRAEWSKEKGPDLTHLKQGVTALDLRREPERYVLQLDYWRFNNLLDIQPPPGSRYIRATTEPFNEEMELSQERLIHWLKRFDINRDNDHRPIQIHASGHASGPELLRFVQTLAPKMLIPIHTEHPQWFKEKLSGSDIRVIVPEEGEAIGFGP
jgi:ribonuclease J